MANFSRFATRLLPIKHVVDCLCGLAVILAKQMRVNPQRDVGLRMAQTLADCHDINAGVDELAGVSVAQAMEGHIGQSDA